ncbi:GNAT family N-acetyltransferase [Chromobacterium haemolyticum]|uniref:GNAT family N-acetyltransferase n=1 Tax=Chromobacterium fluminis TaxID=3044269 RepID=A0ABX0LGU9_9NEIS|nr:GNAT family N-acetyltransferase [Chromobacterium haemolyticum]NHR08443.1 GNAT family N-acetyltransferase [Chromobacterium haemolyticum]
MAATCIRPAAPEDFARLAEIERAAAARFDPQDLPPALADDALPRDELAAAHAAGLLWVAADADGTHGFLLARRYDDSLHLQEMDVCPRRQGQGLGSALIAHAETAAHRLGLRRLTLTTFEHLAWNAPYYYKRGFLRLDAADCPLFLLALLRAEAQHGLKRRVAMHKPLF